MENWTYGLVGALVGAGIATGVSYAVWGRPAVAPVAPGGAINYNKQLSGKGLRRSIDQSIAVQNPWAVPSVPVIEGATATVAGDGGYANTVRSVANGMILNRRGLNPAALNDICRRIALLPNRGAGGAGTNEVIQYLRMSRELSRALDGQGADLGAISNTGNRDYYLALALKKTADGSMHSGLDMPWQRVNWETYGDSLKFANTAAFMRDVAAALADQLARECPTAVQAAR